MRRNLLLVLGGLLLVSTVSPLTYLPNPLGVAYLVAGGYSYDARLPLLVNRFALLRGDPEAALRAKLDGLVGLTGLDPLDPHAPLVGYQVETVAFGRGDWAHGTVRMDYADGSSRRYAIPVVEGPNGGGPGRTRPGGWAYTGLDRLFAPHRALPGLPAAGRGAPVRLGAPRRLPLPEEAHRLGTGLLHGWYTSAERAGEEPLWSPDGAAFLLRVEADPRGAFGRRALWLVPLDGSAPRRLAEDAAGYDEAAPTYAWSADGRWVVYLRAENPGVPFAPSRWRWDVVVRDLERGAARVVGRADRPAHPAALGDAAFYLTDGALWRAPLAGGDAARALELPGMAPDGRGAGSLALGPDGGRVAYRCGDALCLVDADGADPVRVDLGATTPAPSPVPTPAPPLAPRATPAGPGYAPPPPPVGPAAPAPTLAPGAPVPRQPVFARLAVAWSPAGDRLAAVASDHGQGATQSLWVFDRGGTVLLRAAVGPNGLARAPRWTPDGRWLFLTTFPEGGRRIVAVEAATGRVLDLSQPRWDAFASLAPDGRRLLLWNGRGGFWEVTLDGS